MSDSRLVSTSEDWTALIHEESTDPLRELLITLPREEYRRILSDLSVVLKTRRVLRLELNAQSFDDVNLAKFHGDASQLCVTRLQIDSREQLLSEHFDLLNCTISAFPSLTALDLAVSTSWDTADALAAQLFPLLGSSQGPRLEALTLRKLTLDYEGGDQLVSALRTRLAHTLTQFVLRADSFEDGVGEVIVQSFFNSRTLQRLELR
jgi:hypothetical protein